MLRFDPPELSEKLSDAIRVWKALIEPYWDYDFSEDIIDVAALDFDPADYEDRLITADTEFTLGLPRWEDEVRVTHGQFIDLAMELESADLRDNRECWTHKRLLVCVDLASEAGERYLYRTLPEADSEEERQELLELVSAGSGLQFLTSNCRL